MKRANSFGVRGMTAEERAAANPYLGVKVPLGGHATRRADGTLVNHDEALRQFMLSVYNYMFVGLLITGLTALMTYKITVTGNANNAALWDDGTPIQITSTEYLTELGMLLWGTPVSYLVCFGPLLLLIFCAPVFRGLNTGAAMGVYFLVATLIGVSFSGLALTYTNASIASVFFTTAATFGALSLFGYTTKKDLSGWGGFLWMGFLGLLAASIVNIFLGSAAVEFAVCSIGVIVFAGFTIYDTQMIKEAYNSRMGEQEKTALAINGALDLYLDFVNLFRFLLYFLGQSEE